MAPRARGLSKSVHTADQLAFCGLMRAARQKAGLTQHELARRLRKPQSFIAKFELGERRLDVVEFLAIMQAMEADPERLLRALIRHKS